MRGLAAVADQRVRPQPRNTLGEPRRRGDDEVRLADQPVLLFQHAGVVVPKPGVVVHAVVDQDIAFLRGRGRAPERQVDDRYRPLDRAVLAQRRDRIAQRCGLRGRRRALVDVRVRLGAAQLHEVDVVRRRSPEQIGSRQLGGREPLRQIEHAMPAPAKLERDLLRPLARIRPVDHRKDDHVLKHARCA